MKELKQLYFHKPLEGEIGDCWRTCIACLLDADSPEYVPHYYEELWKGDLDIAQEVHVATNLWLVSAGFKVRFVEYPIECQDLDTLKTYISHYYKDMYVVVGCNSKHGGHSVIMKNDNYMWDPSKDDSGCVGPMKDGYYWIGNLIRV